MLPFVVGMRPHFAFAMLVGGCGRLDFVPVATDAAISWVKVFVAHGHDTSDAVDTFTAAAASAGDAILIHAYCTSNAAVSGVSLDAPGWSVDQIGPLTGSTTSSDWVASFGAIAPDAATATFTVTWSETPKCAFMDELGDELANADLASGVTAHAETFGNDGDCVATLTPGAGDAVWSACSGNVSACGVGYSKGADDLEDDWSEYDLASAGTPEQVTFTNTATSWIMTTVSVEPR